MRKTMTLAQFSLSLLLIFGLGWMSNAQAQQITDIDLIFQSSHFDGGGYTRTDQNVTATLPPGQSTVGVDVKWRFDANFGYVWGIANTWRNSEQIGSNCVSQEYWTQYVDCQTPFNGWTVDLVAGYHNFTIEVRLIDLHTGHTIDTEYRSYSITVNDNSLSAYISGPTSACYGQYKTWYANTSGGSGNKSYRWDISYAGGSYSYAGSGSSFSTYMPPPGMDIDLKLTVTAGSDQAIDYHHVNNTGYCNSFGPKNLADKIPKEANLYPNYPNPFSQSTHIRFDLPDVERVKIEIFDLQGKRVKQLVDEQMKAGRHDILLDATELTTGLYLCRMQAGSFVKTIKMNLNRE